MGYVPVMAFYTSAFMAGWTIGENGQAAFAWAVACIGWWFAWREEQ